MKPRGQLFIQSPRWPGRNAHSSEMRELLGLGAKGKLPVGSMPKRLIQGIEVWVEPQTDLGTCQRWGKTVKVKSSAHRVMARCPCCGEAMSAGRLHQHVCKAGHGRLMADGEAVARSRGHSLGPWWQQGPHRWQSICMRPACGCYVQVNTRPAPNDIDCGGTALALNCQTKSL